MDTATKKESKKEQLSRETTEAIDYLRNLFEGDVKPVVGTILRHCSKSGMSRDISLYYKDINITYYVAKVLGNKLRNSNGFNAVRVSGCGMDMGFYLVYSLSCALYGSLNRGGYAVGHKWL